MNTAIINQRYDIKQDHLLNTIVHKINDFDDLFLLFKKYNKPAKWMMMKKDDITELRKDNKKINEEILDNDLQTNRNKYYNTLKFSNYDNNFLFTDHSSRFKIENITQTSYSTKLEGNNQEGRIEIKINNYDINLNDIVNKGELWSSGIKDYRLGLTTISDTLHNYYPPHPTRVKDNVICHLHLNGIQSLDVNTNWTSFPGVILFVQKRFENGSETYWCITIF